MISLRAFLAALVAAVWLVCGSALGQPFGFLCAYDSATSAEYPPPSLLTEQVGVLVIFSAGSSDCEALDGSNYLKPWWADSILSESYSRSLTRYYSDNSLGALTVTGTIASRANDDSCFYSRHIPCGYAWAPSYAPCQTQPDRCMWCNVCPDNCGGLNPCAAEYDSFYADIMGQVDARYDLSDFDITGPSGVPDGFVDYVILVHLNYREVGQTNPGMGLGGLRRDYVTGDGVTIRSGVTCWVPDDYLYALSLIAHEFGHTIYTHQPDWTHAGLTDYDHIAIGSFDVMSVGGFSDGQVGYPSLYNPWSRSERLYWASELAIQHTQFDFAVQPYSDPERDYDAQGRCYKLASSRDPNQYLLITSHNRSSPWETYWPSAGVLAWRVNSNSWAGSYSARDRRILEIEPGGGLFDWDSVGFYTNWHGDRLSIAVNTAVADPITGHDSLDYLYTMRNSAASLMFDTSAGYHGAGGVSQFFTPGLSMDDHANPSTRLRVNQSPQYPRFLNSGFGLRNIRESMDHNFTADLVVNSWQGTMTQSHTWFDTVQVTGELNADIGCSLIIQPGTRVVFSSDVHLDVYGKFRAIGTEEEPIIFEFPSNTGGGGLYFMGTDTVQLEHCIIKRSPMLTVSGGAHLWISDCTFDSCYYGLHLYDAASNAAFIEDNLFTHCTYGILGYLSAGTIQRNVLEHCIKTGIFWQGDRVKGERAYFAENEIRGCGFGIPYFLGGAYFSGSTAILECNLFEHNYKYQVNCANNANVVMNGDYSGRGKNELTDTVAVTWCGDCNENIPTNFRPLLHLNNSYPALDGGYNSFRLNPLGNSSDGCFIFDKSQRCSVSFSYNIEQNYYELAGVLADPPDSNNLHFCPPTAFSDVDPADEPSVCTTTLLSGLSDPQAAYAEAAAMETSGDLAGASAEYADVIEEYPETVQAIWSTRGYLRTGLANEVPAMQRHDELLAIWNADSLHEGMRRAARCEAVWALVAATMYDDARTELEAIRTDPTSGDDSLWAVETAYLVDFLDTGAGVMRAESRGEQLRTRLRTLHERLELLAMEDVIEEEAAATSSGALPLATAHPNPFNSTVAIELNLPNAGPAKVEIFNLLGQKVTTLLDKPLAAGLTRLTWNADKNAAGVYLYHVEYMGRVETRKLLLLK